MITIDLEYATINDGKDYNLNLENKIKKYDIFISNTEIRNKSKKHNVILVNMLMNQTIVKVKREIARIFENGEKNK